jgi:hypothetical protein
MHRDQRIRLAVCCGIGLLLGLANDASAALVICKKGKRITLRETACKTKEVTVPAADLGVTGPQGPTGPGGAQGNPGAPGDPGPPGLSDAFSTGFGAQLLLTTDFADAQTLSLQAGNYVVSVSATLFNLDSGKNGIAICRVRIGDAVNGSSTLIAGTERYVGIAGVPGDNQRVYAGQGAVTLTTSKVLHLECSQDGTTPNPSTNLNVNDGVLTAIRVGPITTQ